MKKQCFHMDFKSNQLNFLPTVPTFKLGVGGRLPEPEKKKGRGVSEDRKT